MFSQLQFEFFRGFRTLHLEGLRRVNLVVGKNNSGKTSVLEGIALLASPGAAASQFAEFRQLEPELKDRYDWAVSDTSPDGSAELSGIWMDENRAVVLGPSRNKRIVAARAGESASTVAADIPTCAIAAQNKPPQNLVISFGNAVRRQNGEELIQSTLRSVDPRINKVRIVPSQKGQSHTQIVVDIGLSRLVPLSQVGQGTYRLVETFSEIIGASAQVAFIDEIENGIHHSCLIDVWKGLANAAADFGVQIFATTHSHECIEAAHAAFRAQPTYDFAIVQLFREADDIKGRVLDQQHIAAGIAGDIDLRG
jgi:hypothetical protein